MACRRDQLCAAGHAQTDLHDVQMLRLSGILQVHVVRLTGEPYMVSHGGSVCTGSPCYCVHTGMAFTVDVCSWKLSDEAFTFLFLHPSALTPQTRPRPQQWRIPPIVEAGDRAPLYVCIQRRAQTEHPPPPPAQHPPHTPSIKNLLQTRPPFSTEEGPSV